MNRTTTVPPLASVSALGAPAKLTNSQLDQLVRAVIRRGDSHETKRAYRYDAARFMDWLAETTLTPATVTPDDLDAYREWLVAVGEARSTINRRLGFVRSLYAEADRRRLLPYNPAAWLRNLRGRDPDGATPALSLAQAREMKQRIETELAASEVPSTDEQSPQTSGSSDAAPPINPRLLALRDRAMVVGIMLQAGLRRSEVARLRVSDIRQDGGYWIIPLTGKGRVKRRAKLQPAAVGWINDWVAAAGLAADDPLFVRVAKGGRLVRPFHRMNDASIDAVVRRRLAQIGLSGERWGAHAMRATFITLAAEGGAPLDRIQRAAGHADPRTTERYVRRSDDLDNNAADYIHL